MNTEIARKKCEYVEELIGTIEGFDEYIKDFTLNNACEVKFSFPDGSSIFFEDYNGTRSPNYPLIAADVLIPFFKKEKAEYEACLEKALEELKEATLAEVAR